MQNKWGVRRTRACWPSNLLLHRIAPHCNTLQFALHWTAEHCSASVTAIPSPLSSVQSYQWITDHLPSYLLELVPKMFFEVFAPKQFLKLAWKVGAADVSLYLDFSTWGNWCYIKVVVSELQNIFISMTRWQCQACKKLRHLQMISAFFKSNDYPAGLDINELG